jgi:hypothetical protein
LPSSEHEAGHTSVSAEQKRQGIEDGLVKRLDKLAGVVLTRRLDGKIVARADRCAQVQIRRADEPRTPRMNPVGR